MQVNIEKRHLFLILAMLVGLVGVAFVIAYNPGGTANPAVFGHSFNEVVSCRVVQGPITTTAVSVASCASDEYLLGGGGQCETGISGDPFPSCGTNLGFLHDSHPAGNAWQANCFRHDNSGESCVQAYAICCK